MVWVLSTPRQEQLNLLISFFLARMLMPADVPVDLARTVCTLSFSDDRAQENGLTIGTLLRRPHVSFYPTDPTTIICRQIFQAFPKKVATNAYLLTIQATREFASALLERHGLGLMVWGSELRV